MSLKLTTIDMNAEEEEKTSAKTIIDNSDNFRKLNN